ncbi:MAG: VanZ family protein, partial [Candidatus Curtissbacteria bacterium]|nr:VanZ family protein [Candidatus Curtissbacteria bacterium]
MKTLNLWLPVFLWAAVIFFFSTLTNPKASDFFIWDFIAKKIAHISEYAILYMLLFRATGKNVVLSFVITILYAISDEIHQGFIPG